MKSYPTKYEIIDDGDLKATLSTFDSELVEVMVKGAYTLEEWKNLNIIIEQAIQEMLKE